VTFSFLKSSSRKIEPFEILIRHSLISHPAWVEDSSGIPHSSKIKKSVLEYSFPLRAVAYEKQPSEKKNGE
jgi:hypothetical protein